jgi:hypothetical protein
MSQIKSLFAAYWPTFWPLIVLIGILGALIVSRSARQSAKMALRVLSRPLLLLAVIALVYDATRSMNAGSGFIVTSLGEHWSALAPTTLQTAQATVRRRLHPALWDDGMTRLLRLPSWFVFGAMGIGLAWVGRRRDEVKVFVN